MLFCLSFCQYLFFPAVYSPVPTRMCHTPPLNKLLSTQDVFSSYHNSLYSSLCGAASALVTKHSIASYPWKKWHFPHWQLTICLMTSLKTGKTSVTRQKGFCKLIRREKLNVYDHEMHNFLNENIGQLHKTLEYTQNYPWAKPRLPRLGGLA